jgi:hypothetical protein
MANAMTQEQAAMATQFAAARQKAREQAGPQPTKADAVSTPTPKAMAAGGRARPEPTAPASKAGTRFSRSKAGQFAGGRAMLRGGTQLAQTSREAAPAVPGAEDLEMGETPGTEAGVEMSRLQQLAIQRMQAQQAQAQTLEEAQTREAQLKRVYDVMKKLKKLAKLSSAAAIWTIMLLLFSYIKDYILGNLIYNGDPTGVFAKEEANFFGYKVTPLALPEVIILWLVLWNGLMNFLMINLIPILAILAIILAAVGIANIEDIIELVGEIGTEAVAPILGELGLSIPI